MNPDENESAWEDLGYVMKIKQEAQKWAPTRSSYQEEWARCCLDEIRRILGGENEK